MNPTDLCRHCTLIVNDRLDLCGKPAVITDPGRCATHELEGTDMSDRVTIPISPALASKLEELVADDDTALEAIVDKALEGDVVSWLRPKQPVSIVQVGGPGQLRCACCNPTCENVFEWRGVRRCACAAGARPGAGRPRVVQPDLDRE